MRHSRRGFTLIEILVVVAIAGIMAAIWARTAAERRTKAYRQTDVIGAYSVISSAKVAVLQYYQNTGSFPADNDEARLLTPEQEGGSHAKSVEVIDGAIHITIGNNATKGMHGKVLSYRPTLLTDAEYTPNIVWACGNQDIIPGREAVGENLTTISQKYLPRNCRGSEVSDAIEQKSEDDQANAQDSDEQSKDKPVEGANTQVDNDVEAVNRFVQFDKLLKKGATKKFPKKLAGYWTKDKDNFIYIDSDGLRMNYSRKSGKPCFDQASTLDLVNYGGGYFISKQSGNLPERFIYSTSGDRLKTEQAYSYATRDVTEYKRVDYDDEHRLNICSG